jgi:predicted ATPase
MLLPARKVWDIEAKAMKIRELTVEGFRSLKNVTWHPGDLNVVIGPNGAGKSNLLRVLEVISVSAQGRLGRYIQSFGGMEPLVWDGKAERIAFRVKTSPLAQSLPQHDLTYEVELVRLGAGSTYRVEYELLGDYYRVGRGEVTTPFKHLERRNLVAKVFDEQERGLVAPAESVLEEETLLSLTAGPFTANKLIPPFQKELAAWSIYHDLHVNRDAPIRQPVVTRNETRVAPDGQNLISVLHTLYTGDRNFKQAINAAMRAAFGDDFDELIFPPASDQRIQLRVRWKTLDREQSAADISDGTLRLLFLLTVLASPSPAPVIAIDEPETGLHPSMFPIVAEYAVDASARSQVIMTTHSDQFLDAFGDTPPTTTVAKWIDGETNLNTLDGEALRYWLSEYSLGKLYRSGELESLE